MQIRAREAADEDVEDVVVDKKRRVRERADRSNEHRLRKERENARNAQKEAELVKMKELLAQKDAELAKMKELNAKKDAEMTDVARMNWHDGLYHGKMGDVCTMTPRRHGVTPL